MTLAVLALEVLQPLALSGRQAVPLAAVDLRLVDPVANGLRAVPELAGDMG